MVIYISIKSLQEEKKLKKTSGKAGGSSVYNLSVFTLGLPRWNFFTPFFQQIYTCEELPEPLTPGRRNDSAGLPLDGSTQHCNNIPVIPIQLCPWAEQLWRRECAQGDVTEGRGDTQELQGHGVLPTRVFLREWCQDTQHLDVSRPQLFAYQK